MVLSTLGYQMNLLVLECWASSPRSELNRCSGSHGSSTFLIVKQIFNGYKQFLHDMARIYENRCLANRYKYIGKGKQITWQMETNILETYDKYVDNLEQIPWQPQILWYRKICL